LLGEFAKGSVEENTHEDVLAGVIKLTYFVCVPGISIIAGIWYTVDCRIHVLDPLLPICTNGDHAESYWLIGILAAVQVIFVTIMTLSFFLYVDIITAVIIFGTYLVEEML